LKSRGVRLRRVVRRTAINTYAKMVAIGPNRRIKRLTVESCLTLDINRLIRERVVLPGSLTRGIMYWNNAVGERAVSITYEADLNHPASSWLNLGYVKWRSSTGQPHEIDQRLPLTTTRPHLGGWRWWFLDGGCRVGRIYLLPDGDQFRARLALELVYSSQYGNPQTSP